MTVYRIIDQPNEEQRKMAYVLSLREEIVSLISYMVGCMLGRYSPYVDGLLYAGGPWDEKEICARIAEGAKSCDFYDESLGLFLPDEIQERLRTQLEGERKTVESADGRARVNAVKRAQKLEKQLMEVNQYEEIVHHYADMRLELELDDGVKANYAKLAELLTKIK